MRSNRLIGAIPVALVLIAGSAQAQGSGDVYWHIDPNVKTCSMALDPSLTQAQWGTFTRQVGAMVSFKSLAPAEPLGTLNVAFGIEYASTPIDQRDPAWINTFVHPDADCPLGDRIEMPTLRARLGISPTMDVGAYWTTAPDANYGLVGGEVRYAFLRESARRPAAGVSTSFTLLTGVDDFNVGVYSVGLATSKRFAALTPYLGVRENLAIGTETTAKVDLQREQHLLTQGFIGATYSLWRLRLSAEYNVANVNTLAFVIGSGPLAE